MAYGGRGVKLTPEQHDVVNEERSCLVKACPGSGKTRAIIGKLLKVCEEVRDSPRRVACITYTNAAVHEISRRIQKVGGLPDGTCEINTIHTFCLLNILRPFAHLLGDEVPAGFGILGPDSPELFAIGGEIFGGQINRQYFRDMLMNIKRRDHGIFCPENLDAWKAAEFYDQISARGLLTFGDIVYLSEKIVSKFPFVRRSLASRFYRIIVDEFQDTSPEQANILKAIAGVNRTRLMLVGDENQSIFGFSDARPDIFSDFVVNADFPILEKTFTGNFRCSSLIVETAEKICERNPSMVAVGSDRDCTHEIQSIYSANASSGILEHFIPIVEAEGISFGNCAILAPQWWELRSLGRILASRGVPVVGPGARPYRRASEFTNVAEAAAECVVAPSSEAQSRLERALTFCLRSVNRGNSVRGDRWEKRKAVCRIRRAAGQLHGEDLPAIEWIEALAEIASEILESSGLTSPHGKLQIQTTAQAMASQIQENHRSENAADFGIHELAVFSNPKNSIQLSTIHSAKGLEWDAVALVDLHEGKMPHQHAVDVDESRRLFYVGCTRAKKILMLLTHDNRPPSRFLSLLNKG
jgi:DNA helicase-2/ATP-dependent DNA helicase PcrA